MRPDAATAVFSVGEGFGSVRPQTEAQDEQAHVRLEVSIVSQSPLRVSPAGVAVWMGTVAHASSVQLNHASRKLAFEIELVALGGLAKQCAALALNTRLLVTGYLTAARPGGKKLQLLASSLMPLPSQPGFTQHAEFK